MGNKLDKIKKIGDDAEKINEEALEKADEAVIQIKDVKTIADGISSEGDDEIGEGVKIVIEAAVNEGEGYLNSEIKGELDEGEQLSDNAITEAEEQRRISESAENSFNEIAERSEYGRIAAKLEAGEAGKLKEDFSEEIDKEKQKIEEAKKKFLEKLHNIQY